MLFSGSDQLLNTTNTFYVLVTCTTKYVHVTVKLCASYSFSGDLRRNSNMSAEICEKESRHSSH